ncbi:MAG TPA: hypothetical protein VK506_00715 [Conexibacter sp.]|nr:hypothetical protein [Conexibacter sp.]
MTKKIKLLLTAAIALVAITAFASSASAFTARTAPGGNITADSNGRLTFGSGITSIQCEVSLIGDLAVTAGIDAGDQFGTIDAVRIANETCSGGIVLGVLNLSWRLTVRALQGTAPNELLGFSFDISTAAFELEGFFGVDCLYSGRAAGLQRLIDTGVNTYRTEDQRALEEVTLPRNTERSDGACPATGGFRGTFDMTPVQSITVS